MRRQISGTAAAEGESPLSVSSWQCFMLFRRFRRRAREEGPLPPAPTPSPPARSRTRAMSVGTSALAPPPRAPASAPDPPRLGVRVPRRTPIPIVDARPSRRSPRRADAPRLPPARAPVLGLRRGRLAAAFAGPAARPRTRKRRVRGRRGTRAGAGADRPSSPRTRTPPRPRRRPRRWTSPRPRSSAPRTGATPDGGLAFDPARARRRARARPAANKPAEGQTEESHPAAMTPPTSCANSTASTRSRRTRAQGRLLRRRRGPRGRGPDRLLTEEGFFSFEKSLEDEPKSETPRARPDENETRQNGPASPTACAFPRRARAALSPRSRPSAARSRGPKTRRARLPFRVPEGFEPGSAARGTHPARTRAYPSFAGASTDPDALAAAAPTRTRPRARRGVPRGARYAKQLRYDGYKIVSSPPRRRSAKRSGGR